MNSDLSYGDFAFVYDRLTSDVEYRKRADYINKLIKMHFDGKAELVCDLGCGTGTMCTLLSDYGYDCIGVDLSEDMLNVAAEKSIGKKILYLNQDMCDFELYGTVDVIISMLDSINYIENPADLQKMFYLVNNYLNPGGIFIFDVNSEYKFEKILGNNTFTYETDGIFYTWENFYENEVLDLELNFFVKEKGGLYRRINEHHTQRYYSVQTLENFAKNSGLHVKDIYGDMSFTKPQNECERIFFVVCKQ